MSKTKILPSPMRPVRAADASAVDDLFYAGIRDHHLSLILGKQVDGIFPAAEHFLVSLLASIAARLRSGHAVHADVDEGVFRSVEFGRLQDRYDFFMLSPNSHAILAGPGTSRP